MIRFLGSTLLSYVKNNYPILGSRERERESKRLRRFAINFFLILALLLQNLLFLASPVYASSSPWSQTDWSGGSGQTSWSDNTKFDSSSSVTTSTAGQATLTNTEKFLNTGFESDLSSWDSAQTYTLYDQFTTDKTSAQLKANNTTAEPTGGIRTVTDTNSKLSITNSVLTSITGGFGQSDPGLWYSSKARAAGKAFLVHVNSNSGGGSAFDIGWDGDQTSFGLDYFWFAPSGVLEVCVNGGACIVVGTFTDGVNYELANIMRSSGNLWFIRGGSEYPNWTLVWLSTGGAGARFPMIDATSTVSIFTADNARIPTTTWLPTPLVSDGFSTTTTDGLGHTEANGGSGLSWTDSIGTWQSSGSVASATALSGGIAVRTVSSGSSNILMDAALTRSAGNVGIIARYADSNNYLIAYHDGTNIHLDKVVDGSTTSLINSAAAYSAGAVVRLSVTGTNADLYYNNAKKGSTVVVPSSTATTHGLYTTNTGNTIDNFVVWTKSGYTDATLEDLAVTRDTATTYSSSLGSAKLVAAGNDANFTQSVNIGDTNKYNLSAYVYTGGPVTTADLNLYVGTSTISTTFTPVDAGLPNGWYRLTGTTAGTASPLAYGVRVKAGKTVYVDNMSLNNYASSGTLTSSIYDTELTNATSWGNLTYTATTPTNTTVTVKARTSNSSSMSGATAFSSCNTITSGTDISSNNCVTDGYRYIQYQLDIANTSTDVTPTFQDITLAYSSSDNSPPTISLTAVSPDPTTNTTPALGGTATEESGVVTNVQYQMDSTSGSWSSCTANDGSFNSASEAFTCTVSPASSDGSHTMYVRATDSNGNTTSSGYASDSFTIDTTAPTPSSKTTFSGWYTANQTSTFAYTDGSGSGIASGTPVTCIISTEGSSQTCSVTPNVCDALGNCNITLVTSNGANIDKTAPASGSIGYTDGYFTSTSIPLTVGDGSDSNSGVNTASRTFQRQSASLLLGICGIYGSFSPITPTPNPVYPSFTDTTVVSGNCYKYEYQVSDTAGNQATYTSGNAARIDTSSASTPGTPSTTNPNNSSSQNWTWIAATDAISDVANYLWRTTGTAIASGSSAVNSAATTLGDGLYNFFVKAVDTAGNQGSESSVSNIRIDTTAPSVPGTPTTASLTTVNKPVWTWTSSTDSGSGLAATPYSVQWCGNSSFTGCDANTDTATTNTYTHATALADGTWYFRVKATDIANNSSAYSSNGTDTINTASTASSGSSSSSSNNSSSNSAPSCNKTPPGAKAPWLYGAITQDSGSILLYFTPADDPVEHYALEFGTKSGEYIWGATTIGGKETRTYLVKSLSPNTTYYFRVRAGNECAVGGWSNEISATTKGYISTNNLNIVSSELKPVITPQPEVTTTPTSNSCQTYTVKYGDTLSSIANSLLGDANRYKEIIDQNKDIYLSLETSNSVRVGWELKINCTDTKTTETQKTTEEKVVTQNVYVVKVRVVDTDKKPVVGANVTIHSKVQTAITNNDGMAEFKNVEQGDHKVLIAYGNYKGEQSVNLTGDVKEFDLNVQVKTQSVFLSWQVIAVIGVLVFIILLQFFLAYRRRQNR